MINRYINLNRDITFNISLNCYIGGCVHFKYKLSDKGIRRDIFQYAYGMLEYSSAIGMIKADEFQETYNKLRQFLDYEG